MEISTFKNNSQSWFTAIYDRMSIIDYLLMIIFAIAIGTRGVFPQIISEGTIWIVAAYYFLKDGIISKLNFQHLWILLFLIMVAYFALNVIAKDAEDTVSIFYYFILFIPFLIIFNTYDRCRFFAIVSGIIAVITCLQLLSYYFLGAQVFEDLVLRRSGGIRAIGYMGNPNYFGYYSFAIFLISQLFNFRFKRFFSVALFIIIVLTISRGILIGLIIFFVISVFKDLKNLIIAAIVTFLVVYNLDILLPENFSNQFISRLADLDSDNAGSGRSLIWVTGIEIWSQSWSDIMIGFGFNNFKNRLNFTDVENTVHNSYLRMLFELGVIGFLLIMSFFTAVVSQIKWPSKRELIKYIIPILLVWFSNDFIINKETFYMLAVFITVYLTRFMNQPQLDAKYDR